jgi:predicted nucleic acid-binding protein
MAQESPEEVIRAFLDANVLFRAAQSRENASWGVFDLAEKLDDFAVMTTEYVFGEAEEHLHDKAPESLDEYASLKAALETCPEPPDAIDAIAKHLERLIRDEDDRPVLAGAIYAKADWFLTLDDGHFGHLYGIQVYDVLITTPAQGLHRFRRLAGMV